MDNRILLLVEDGREAQAIIAQLGAAGMEAEAVAPRVLAAAIQDCTLGAVLISDTMLDRYGIDGIVDAVAAQPVWSDCPVLLLAHRDVASMTDRLAVMALANVTLLERPLRTTALVMAARAALRARARQRMAQAYLDARDAAEAQVRALAAGLEARVVARTAALSQEMTRRKLAETRLRDSEELYRMTLQLNAQVPWTTDAQGAPLGVGEGWEAMTGISYAQFVAHDWVGTVHEEDMSIIIEARTASRTVAAPYDIEFRVHDGAGGFRWLRSRGAPRRAPDGTVLRWYGIIEDVDARHTADARYRLLQSELIHVSRSSAMVAMASTLAHELNQPLTAVANYVRGSRRLLAALGDDRVMVVQEALEQADVGALRAGEILRRLRRLAASDEAERRASSLPDLIREAIRVALPDTGAHRATCRTQLDAEASTVFADRIQIEQVLINLLRNAAEAMAAAPVRDICITTRRRGDMCEVAVRDSGPGIAADVAARLFEPFASTKPTGMGVGLAISRTIIEEHGGQISHEAPGAGGTIIRFTLPVAPPSA